MGGKGGIPGETPPAAQQPGGHRPEPAAWLKQFIFNRKINDSCFILSHGFAGSEARTLSRKAYAFHPLWLFFSLIFICIPAGLWNTLAGTQA